MDDILILQAARFGDLVQSKRLVLSLSAKATVHLGIDRSLASLARVLYPDAIIHEINFHGRPETGTLSDNLEIFKKLREIRFSEIYNCNFSTLTAVICRLFAKDIIKGYRPVDHSEGGIVRSPWARLVFALSRHRASAALNIEDFWSWLDCNPVLPFTVNPQPLPGGRGIGVVLSGRESRRSLSVEMLAAIIKIIFNIKNGPTIKLFGSQSEMHHARKLSRLLPPAILQKTEDLTGKTALASLPDEVTGLDLLITPDTGIMHLGASLGVPVMAFFLSSAWCHETGPYGQGHLVWQAVEKCSPCLESMGCPNRNACHNIFSSDIFARILGAVLANPAKLPDFPPTLQLWKTEFDELGVKMDLIGGKDNNCLRREAARMFLKDFHHLSTTGMSHFPIDILQLMAKEFYPAPEWMLPSERYF